MKVNEGDWRQMKVNEAYWRQMKVNEVYWRQTHGNEGEEGFGGWAVATVSGFL